MHRHAFHFLLENKMRNAYYYRPVGNLLACLLLSGAQPDANRHDIRFWRDPQTMMSYSSSILASSTADTVHHRLALGNTLQLRTLPPYVNGTRITLLRTTIAGTKIDMP